MKTTVYITGVTPEGTKLIGGAWALRRQEGFPLEMSHLEAHSIGASIDWIEAMFDASTHNECPQLMDQISQFLDAEFIQELKIRFLAMLSKYESYKNVMEYKQKNAQNFYEFMDQVRKSQTCR